MLKGAKVFSRYSSEHFGFDVQTGVGIAFGPAVIGKVGYYRNTRRNCIGDVVNTASRVQDATQEHGASLLVTDSIRRLIVTCASATRSDSPCAAPRSARFSASACSPGIMPTWHSHT
jgi:class 3 adenylate cyclase